MKANIHPKSHNISVHCSCGNDFVVSSVYANDKLNIEICDKCHPFFSGEQKIMDTQGRVEKFKQRYKIVKPTK